MAETVKSYQDVVESVGRFNEDLKKSKELQRRLSNNRAWYYIPELDQVGPSKFVGYKGMTAQRYIHEINELSGTETEPVLRKWFKLLGNESSEATSIKKLVDNLLSQHDKKISAVARFNIPYKTSSDRVPPPPSRTSSEQDNTDASRPIVEVFWRAFLGLYPEDQEALTKRIIRFQQTR